MSARARALPRRHSSAAAAAGNCVRLQIALELTVTHTRTQTHLRVARGRVTQTHSAAYAQTSGWDVRSASAAVARPEYHRRRPRLHASVVVASDGTHLRVLVAVLNAVVFTGRVCPNVVFVVTWVHCGCDEREDYVRAIVSRPADTVRLIDRRDRRCRRRRRLRRSDTRRALFRQVLSSNLLRTAKST